MSLTTLRRSRPSAAPRIPKAKWVCFRLGQELYGIPIQAVQHILQEYTPQGVLNSGESLTQFRDQPLLVVDLSTLFTSSTDPRDRHYLIICTLSSGETVGLPVPEMPTILETTLDSLQPLPPSYRQAGIPAVVDQLVQTATGSSIFLLQLEQLTLPS